MAQFSLSARIERIEPSATIAMSARSAELQAAGKDVVNLTTGEPDFDTPEHIKEAARKALANGETKYTAVAGTVRLREAICRKLGRDSGLDYGPDDVVATCGAKHAIMNLFLVAADHGDEVVIPTPCWVTYPDVAQFCGAKPVYVDASIEDGFKINPEQLEEALTDRSRIFVINTPSNPTGAVYSAAELKALGEVLAKYPKVIIASDEIYEHITYGDAKHVSFPEACPELKDRTVIFNGVSKAYAMTGWRMGFSASHPELAKAMRKIQSQTTTNICSIAQAAAAAALDSELDNLKPMLEAFAARRAKVLQAFDDLEGVEIAAIDGAFYGFIEVGGAARQLAADGVIPEPSDKALAEHLLSEKLVSTVYGAAFKSKDPALRLSFATNDELLAKGLERLRAALG
ncbi:MAG: pyridoxal phosphate-dependent aminotransferase [Betaproteobacteria bacterium AqS2]|uniref:Aminotransferase n=1 Tax=Candidatus Amphirhobacter heronislandensis TaxID=1732024 RepID=A0A930UG18_9GAMM|nr:pyridoxal phosphate-dependent aminotransferase [Betaproteobacteria bacterium AqS2]